MITTAIVMDTSFLVATYLPTDRHHGIAVKWLAEHYVAHDLITPSLARCEFASALARNGVSPTSIDEALGSLSHRFTMFDTTEDILRIATDIARDQKLRGCDSVFVALALQQRAPLVTFDVDQAKKGSLVINVEFLPAIS